MEDRADFLAPLQDQLPIITKALEEWGIKVALRTFFNLMHNDGTFECVFLPVQTILGTVQVGKKNDCELSHQE